MGRLQKLTQGTIVMCNETANIYEVARNASSGVTIFNMYMNFKLTQLQFMKKYTIVAKR